MAVDNGQGMTATLSSSPSTAEPARPGHTRGRRSVGGGNDGSTMRRESSMDRSVSTKTKQCVPVTSLASCARAQVSSPRRNLAAVPCKCACEPLLTLSIAHRSPQSSSSRAVRRETIAHSRIHCPSQVKARRYASGTSREAASLAIRCASLQSYSSAFA